jgi:DNA polymerase-1
MEESVVTIGPDGWPDLVGTRREVQAAALEQALLEALRVRGEANTRELLEAVEGEWRVKIRALQALVEKGQVHREGTGKRGDPYRYRLPEHGDSLFRCGIGIAQRSNEIQIRPEPASGLDESVARYSAPNDGVPQRIRGSSATNLTPEGGSGTLTSSDEPAPGFGNVANPELDRLVDTPERAEGLGHLDLEPAPERTKGPGTPVDALEATLGSSAPPAGGGPGVDDGLKVSQQASGGPEKPLSHEGGDQMYPPTNSEVSLGKIGALCGHAEAAPSGLGDGDPKGLLEPLSDRGEARGPEKVGEEARTVDREEEPPPEPPLQEEVVPSGSLGTSFRHAGTSTPDGLLPREVVLVEDTSGWKKALQNLYKEPAVGLDVETCGDVRHPRLRLVQVGTPARVYIADASRFDPVPALRDFLRAYRGTVVLHNAKFDLKSLGFTDPRSWPGDWFPVDTMLAAQIITNGEIRKNRPSVVFPSLQEAVQHWLGVELPKDLQRSSWAGDITGEQLRYAAADAAVLVPLWERLKEELEKAGLVGVFELEQRALPAVVWLEASGAPFDKDMWVVLANEAEARAEELERALLEAAGREFNPRSPKQVLELLKEKGVDLPDTQDATLNLAKNRNPLIPLLLEYRDALKRASVYGAEWVEKHVDQDGRVRSDFQQIGAISGRLSSARPNLQNIPRDPRYRACFRPARGRVLVKVDYNQIELRAAAAFMSLLHDDYSLADAFRRGEDIHSLVAREVLGVLNPTKEDRQRAKSISFGQLYGQGVEGFRRYAKTQFGVEFTPEEARQVLDRFFRLFPGFQKARTWAYSRFFETMDAIYTLSGRRILNPAKLSPQERLNLPVQGSAADGLKAALGLLWERRSELPEGACPVLCVHDELVMECWIEDAEEVARIVREAMIEGMQRVLRTVPVEVEATVCQDWSGAPVELEETREGGDQQVKLEDAVGFLKEALGRGPVPAEEITAKATSRGFSERTLRRARSALGVRSQRRDGRWWWSLSDSVEERVESDDLLRAQGAAVVGPGKDLEDDAASGDPVTELPHLEGVASEEPQVEGSQLGSGAPDDANPVALAARLERTLPGPRHLSGEWILSRCPNCNRWTVAWSFRLGRAVSTCDCLRELGLTLVPELPVQPLALR